jgi:hypothetical protein
MIRRNAKIVLMAIAAQVAVITLLAYILTSRWSWSSDLIWYAGLLLNNTACAAIVAVALMRITQTRWRAPILAATAIVIWVSFYSIESTSTPASFATTDLAWLVTPIFIISVVNVYARGRVTLWELLCIPLASIAIAAPFAIAYEVIRFTQWTDMLAKSTARQIWFTSCLHWILVTTGCCILMPRCLSAADRGRRILSAIALVATALTYPFFVAFGLTALARYSILHDEPFGHWAGDELLTILDSPPGAELLLQALENDSWRRPLGPDIWNPFRVDWRQDFVRRLAELPDQTSFKSLVSFFLDNPNAELAECIAEVCTPQQGIEASPLLLRYSYRAYVIQRNDAFEEALLRMKIPHGALPIIWWQIADGVASDQLSTTQRERLFQFLARDAGNQRDAWLRLIEAPQWPRPVRIPEKVWQQLNAEMEAGRRLAIALDEFAEIDPDARMTLHFWRGIDWDAKSTDDFIQSMKTSYHEAQLPLQP